MSTDAGQGGFITLEGGEGAGKSTQSRRLAERLEAYGFAAVATREPGGSPRAEAIRGLLLAGAAAPLGPLAEAMLFSAARLDHLESTIRPALGRGAFVICDRFADSTRAYQGALGRVPHGMIGALEKLVVGRTRPDLTLVLDLDPALGLARVRARRRPGESADRFEREALAFHAGLREAFLGIAGRDPARCRIIDAGQDPDAVAAAIWAAVVARFAGVAAAVGHPAPAVAPARDGPPA